MQTFFFIEEYLAPYEVTLNSQGNLELDVFLLFLVQYSKYNIIVTQVYEAFRLI